MKNNNSLQEIAEYINKNDDYLIIGHIDPDGDAIGSIMAYKFLLNNMGKKSLLLFHNDQKEEYDILFNYLNSDEYFVYDENDLDKLKRFDKVIALDSANLERLGNYQDIIKGHYIVNIDHHYDNSRYGDLNYVNSDESAVGKIIYDLANLMEVEITKDLGTAIALAVLADTGSLKYPNSDPASFKLIADLKERGIDIVKINRFLQSFPSVKYLKMLAKALANIKVDNKGKIAWLMLTKDEIEKVGIDKREINNLVNYPRDIKGVEVGISFVEKTKDFIDISFRSHSYVDVSKIAHKFNGGGHPRAAGAKVDGKLEEVVEAVISEVKSNV